MSKDMEINNTQLLREADSFIPKTDFDLSQYFEQGARRYNRIFMEEKEATAK